MAKSIKIRSIFDPSDSENPEVGLDCRVADPKTGEFKYQTRTKQADKDACDINNILKRYETTGVLPDLIAQDARYGDFSAVPDFQAACDVVARAEEQFMALSAHVRSRFDNDPAKMLEFCSHPGNHEEMVKLGLAVAKSPATPAAPDSGPAKSDNPASGSAPGKGA